MNESSKQSWYTGDWTVENNYHVPYNGLAIHATPNYGQPTSPPTDQRLVSVLIEVVDYTYNPTGVSTQLTLTKGGWFDIPLPEDITVSPPQPNSDFTVSGIQNSELGQIKLDINSNGIYLNIQFSYGTIGRKKNEIGYILKFSDTYYMQYNNVLV